METVYKQVDDETISIFVPMKIKKRGGAAMVILPKGSRASNSLDYNQKLINALAKAYKWQQMLKNDSRLTITALAEKEKVRPDYVSRFLRLNLLAPDIVIDILEGKQPRDLRLQDLMTKPIPDLWQEQKEVFGF